ncbi:hypothetical protein GCM10026982_09910 [Nocardiopsis aegyptia]
MATFHVGQQTDQAVLPQRLALEFESVDNPGIRDETGLERHELVASGMGHGRGETNNISPGVDGVTPVS